jgi:hypothetical protein
VKHGSIHVLGRDTKFRSILYHDPLVCSKQIIATPDKCIDQALNVNIFLFLSFQSEKYICTVYSPACELLYNVNKKRLGVCELTLAQSGREDGFAYLSAVL